MKIKMDDKKIKLLRELHYYRLRGYEIYKNYTINDPIDEIKYETLRLRSQFVNKWINILKFC